MSFRAERSGVEESALLRAPISVRAGISPTACSDDVDVGDDTDVRDDNETSLAMTVIRQPSRRITGTPPPLQFARIFQSPFWFICVGTFWMASRIPPRRPPYRGHYRRRRRPRGERQPEGGRRSGYGRERPQRGRHPADAAGPGTHFLTLTEGLFFVPRAVGEAAAYEGICSYHRWLSLDVRAVLFQVPARKAQTILACCG
jgi:hypothetical protein